MLDDVWKVPGLEPPALLGALLESGRWPTTVRQGNSQHLALVPLTDEGRSRAPEESGVHLVLYLTTVAQRATNPFWTDPMADPAGIDPELSVVLGDFGLGTDAPIVLDYRSDPARVLRLDWPLRGQPNRWVALAASFDEFIGLLDLPAGRFFTR